MTRKHKDFISRLVTKENHEIDQVSPCRIPIPLTSSWKWNFERNVIQQEEHWSEDWVLVLPLPSTWSMTSEKPWRLSDVQQLHCQKLWFSYFLIKCSLLMYHWDRSKCPVVFYTFSWLPVSFPILDHLWTPRTIISCICLLGDGELPEDDRCLIHFYILFRSGVMSATE